jgi:hypothetical protein
MHKIDRREAHPATACYTAYKTFAVVPPMNSPARRSLMADGQAVFAEAL